MKIIVSTTAELANVANGSKREVPPPQLSSSLAADRGIQAERKHSGHLEAHNMPKGGTHAAEEEAQHRPRKKSGSQVDEEQRRTGRRRGAHAAEDARRHHPGRSAAHWPKKKRHAADKRAQ